MDWEAFGWREMMRAKLSPREIVERLQMIEALTAEGQPLAEAIRSAGMHRVEYDRWRIEYGGLLRTLGALLCASHPKLAKARRRAGAVRRPSGRPTNGVAH